MSAGLFDNRAELEALFTELAEELASTDSTLDVVMVGGSWLLWHAHRSATRDVDSARRFDFNPAEMIERVGSRHDLAPNWLNDAAAAFWPADASFDACETVFRQGGLVVRTPGPQVIFVMKLYRANPQDREDLVTLWPLCAFDSPDHAVQSFVNAYPHAPDDPHLISYIAGVVQDAEERDALPS